MVRNAVCIGALLISTALGGCAVAANAPSFSAATAPAPEPGMALVYIFRDRAEPTMWPATVYFGEDAVTTLRENGFTWAYLAPGQHSISAKWNALSGQENSAITLNVVAGETYHLELLGMSRVAGGIGRIMYLQMGSGLNRLDPQLAVERMSLCCRFQPPAARAYPVSR